MRSSGRIISFMPLFLSIAVAIGILIGYNSSVNSDDKKGLVKYNTILEYVENNYVDEVNKDKLMEKSISSMLQSLDPHSAYIPASISQEYNESLQGHFGGVGIRFRIYNDTLMIAQVIEGGPSQRAGIKPGDRIITVDGENIAGEGLTNEDVQDKLKGRAGSKVSVTVLRDGETLDIDIIRGHIPLKSIEAFYMLDRNIGYLHLTKFSRTTTHEFLRAVTILQGKGMSRLVIDLRNNSGGYLEEAVSLADQILEEGALIVYTKGRKRKREEFRARAHGRLENVEIAVLINENSASASEILAGAIQDNDRGYIIGRRSFGKGLVQERKILDDNSELRLTIARYYTPAGRSIQRPYGNGVDYSEDHLNRFENGELYEIDSSLFTDSLKYYTLNEERPVYGGGGIMPDFFVPFDSSGLNNIASKSLRYIYDEFTYYLLDRKRNEYLDTYSDFKEFGETFSVSDDLFRTLIDSARSKYELKLRKVDIEKVSFRIKHDLKENIAHHLYGFQGDSYIDSKRDPAVSKAIEVLKWEQKKGIIKL